MNEKLMRLAGAFLYVAFIAGFMEVTYRTAVVTGVWVYSIFVFQGAAAVIGAAVILFISPPTSKSKGTAE